MSWLLMTSILDVARSSAAIALNTVKPVYNDPLYNKIYPRDLFSNAF